MKIEIWSDIMCPFCYIGKRKFEIALDQFENKDQVEIVWKSFQLNPDMKTEPQKNINDYLAEVKGWSIEQAKEMNDRVTGIAKAVGLNYDLGKAIVANSFDAHRLIQLAKTHGKGDAAEERLFKAYFMEGKNIADHSKLVSLGLEVGLEPTEVQKMLASNNYAAEVKNDIIEAQRIGVSGVPFFVIDHKYGISGAQESETFLQALNQAWAEQKTTNTN